MVRLVFAFFVVVNVIIALWVNASSSDQAKIYAVDSVPELQGDELILVSEIDPSQLLISDQSKETQREQNIDVGDNNISVSGNPAEVVVPKSPSQCMVLSFFEFKNEAEALADRIRGFGVRVDMLVEEIEADGPIMVYIKPFVSAQEAQRELRVLRSSNIDSFIISEGDLVNGISLGVFRTEQNALAQQVRIEVLGYDVETSVIAIQKEQFSLIASGDVLDALEDDYWLKIASENKDISIEQKPCNEVASGVKFQ